MKYLTTDNWHYKAEEGYYFMKDDVITNDLYLGSYDSIGNWAIITEAEKIAYEEEKAKELEELKEAAE